MASRMSVERLCIITLVSRPQGRWDIDKNSCKERIGHLGNSDFKIKPSHQLSCLYDPITVLSIYLSSNTEAVQQLCTCMGTSGMRVIRPLQLFWIDLVWSRSLKMYLLPSWRIRQTLGCLTYSWRNFLFPSC